jgi:formate/nitrite transporter FocA (FNT family)
MYTSGNSPPRIQSIMPLPKVKLPTESSQQSSTQQDLDRPTAIQIFEHVSRNGRRELARSNTTLAISGIVGGLTMGLTGLSISAVTAQLGYSASAQFIAFLLYPMGFMAVILGRGQLFTENTLYPVAIILDERRYVVSTLRLWGIVFVTNVAGALLFALLCARTSALRPDILDALIRYGAEAAAPSAVHIFWSAVVGGWIIAMVAWLVSGSHSISGSVAIIWVLTFIVGLGHFAHCIASSGEILSAVVSGHVATLAYLKWLALATSGNITGGVVLVTLLQYGQSKLE